MIEGINDDFLLPLDARLNDLARDLYQSIRDLPIISPHGHTDAKWFAENDAFKDATSLLLTPDHYLLRMLHSSGERLETFGVGVAEDDATFDPLHAWRVFAGKFYLFRGTPSGLWLRRVLQTVFGIEGPLSADSADAIYDQIGAALQEPEFRPRALFERFNVEFLATTESATDDLKWHRKLKNDTWAGRVATTYRPDNVTDPESSSFADELKAFAEITGKDTMSWRGYLDAHRVRRQEFKQLGATATDHGHPTAQTLDMSDKEKEALFQRIVAGNSTPEYAEQFRAQMLTEMARMSIDDGLVMQLHPGSCRNHASGVFSRYGPDVGADIPMRTDYVTALRPLLNKFGCNPALSFIVFTLDESTYSRELAPLAGFYPAMKLGPAWWFHDSPSGMMRFRQQTTETAGFYNTVGFNDDTRAFMSIPVRHDVARRIDCAYLANLISDQRLALDDAFEVARDLAYRLPKAAYRIGPAGQQ